MERSSNWLWTSLHATGLVLLDILVSTESDKYCIHANPS